MTSVKLESPIRAPQDWRWLDVPQEWSAFSAEQPAQPGCWTSSVVFEGMHCAACALTIEDALRSVPGVGEVQISGASHRGRVVWDAHRTSPSAWMAAVAQVGYQVVPAQDAQAHEARRREARRMLWRLVVALLCMMQVMMYATPAYVTAPGEIPADIMALLRWASWVLSLPVMLFSCVPFVRNAWRDVRQRQISMDLPVALGMLVTFAISSVGTFDPDGPFGAEVYFDSLTMFVSFLLLGRWLEQRLRDRTAGALEAVLNRLPDTVRRRAPGQDWETVSVRRLALGDVLEVLPGEALAADGVVLVGHTQVDEALLTGESRPLSRGPGERVIAGSHNLSARIEMRVDQLGAATRYAQIVQLMQSAAVDKPRMARLADRVARPFLWGVLLTALAAALWGWERDPAHALMVAVAVLVVTCPCALSLATPAAMLASAGALARQGVLVRRLDALEALASVDTVVFDKTGTLTLDAPQWVGVRTRDGVSAEQALAWASALAQHSLHPLSRALVRQARTQGLAPLAALAVQESPGQGVQGELPGLGPLRWGSARWTGAPALPAQGPAPVQAHLADAQGWVASFEWQEQVRPEAASVVQGLQALGLQLQVLSGDREDAVAHVAQAVGIDDAHGGCLPQDKLARVKALQAQGRRVAMVGDGLNDGPVLAGAQVSFALGQAVPLAQAQSDFVILSGQIDQVLQTLQRSRQTLRIVRQNLWWALAYNAACVPLALMGWLPAWAAGLGMALSSLLVVLNARRLAGPWRAGD
ncbi:MAG: putative copper-transporting ATPase PacS [Pseudomonadota bacterium]|jgi:Cu2+-exporting ATPase